jgi:thiol-disulfide isomerase/thioredoxin
VRSRARLRVVVAVASLAAVVTSLSMSARAAGPVPIISAEQMRKAVSDRKGRVVVLHLWASWCMPCMQELPVVARFATQMKRKGVEIVSVSLDDPTEATARVVARILEQKTAGALAGSIVKVGDPDQFVASVDPRWDGDIPALFAYDRGGRLRRAFTGEASMGALERFVRDLLPATAATESTKK